MFGMVSVLQIQSESLGSEGGEEKGVTCTAL